MRGAEAGGIAPWGAALSERSFSDVVHANYLVAYGSGSLIAFAVVFVDVHLPDHSIRQARLPTGSEKFGSTP